MNATVQTISGTGSLRIGGAFLSEHFLGNRTIYLPSPSWRNHAQIFKHSGLDVKYYRYYDPKTNGFDFQGAMDDISKIPGKSVILFHACGHNPIAVDPQPEQWAEMSKIIKDRRIFPYFDMAYQGFVSGNVARDAAGLRTFVNDGHEIALSQSYSKNMGLYGERAGAFSLMTKSKDDVARCLSQIKILIRPMYSNPPIHGAHIVTEILGDADLKSEWLNDVKGMVEHVVSIRAQLKENLLKEGSSRNWSHITDHVGMFCYSGMTLDQCEQLKSKYGIYMTNDGRIAMVGITSKNVRYVAHAMHQVTK